MTGTPIRFEATEAGLRLLQGTLRNYVREAERADLIPGRIRRTELGSTDPRELAVHAAFLRLVSVTEATVDSLGVELTNRTVGTPNAVIQLLMLEKELAATAAWSSRRRSFKRHHHVDLAKCAEHKRVESAIEVRNAIAHGLGKVTTRQLTSSETTRRLQLIEVVVVNNYVRLGPKHVRDCAEYSAAFLRSLDDKLAAA